MNDFFLYFSFGLSGGFVAGFCFLFAGRAVRRAFGLVGRAALMR